MHKKFSSKSCCILLITNCRIKPTTAMREKTQPDDRKPTLLTAWRGLRTGGMWREDSGVAAVEFALVAPLLLTIALAAITFALALNNYIVVTNASAVGATNLILSRGAATPYTDTVASVRQAAQSLVSGSLTIALSVDGAACSDDTTCATALSSAGGKPANVAVSYPCRLVVLNINFAPGGCVLRQSTAGRGQ